MKIRLIVFAALALIFSQRAAAQDVDALGSYTPYSLYGVGDLSNASSAINKSMGGIGVGVRDKSFVNILNVASLTQRDTLSFMLNVGLLSKNMYLHEKHHKSAYNTVNINNLVMSFPIKNKIAMMIGLTPFSSLGYKYKSSEANDEIVARYGDIQYKKYGNGEIDQLFVGLAVPIVKGLSVGVEGIYYFGNLNYHSDVYYNSTTSMRDLQTGWKRKTTGWSMEAGVQYSQPLPKSYVLTIGATYRMKSNIRGQLMRYAYAIGEAITDTISENKGRSKLTVPAKYAVGVSLRKGEKWMVGIDYERQDWSKNTFMPTPGVAFTAQTAQSIRAGIEFIPNKYDVRYYMKRVTYRAGIHYDQSYIKLDGTSVNGFGFTFGMEFPISRLNTSLNFSIDVGQRGKNSGNLIRERYVNFILSVNLHDIWFIKRKFE